MWMETHEATLEEPAEYKSTAPVSCSTCGHEMDAEDDDGEFFKYIDDKPTASRNTTATARATPMPRR